MCGIAGFTHLGRRPVPGVLQRATQSLYHRGPNQQGTFESPSISLGAVRLKIIDLEGGDQPMRTDDGDSVIVFNGEIYNHVELRRELEHLGHRFQSHCDTEVVLRAFVQWDLDAFPRLRGMFAAALWQERGQRLVLVRDRLGIKPLYYALHDGNLHFGSELKALFEHPDIPRRLSRTALSYFLSLNYVPTPLTLVEGMEKIAPGAWLEYTDGAIKAGTYWKNVFDPQEIGLQEACRELDQLLGSSIAEHLISDVPLGIWASGGLDSSTILHYAAQATSRRLKTFSISFAGRKFDESRYFRPLARHYNTSHHEFDLNSSIDLTSAIHEVSCYSDEPSADAGALPVWFLSQMTAKHVTVALSGEGADEIFGGYQTYLADRYANRLRRLPAPLLRAALNAVNRLPVSDEKIGLEYKLKRFLAGALLPADEAHFYWNGAFSSDEQRTLGVTDIQKRLKALCGVLPNLPPASDVINRYLFVDQHYYLPDDILYKCDRMSMAHSLEVRPPFLDHRIVEFAARLPVSLKIRGRTTKRVLRELMRSKIPTAILDRPKEGLDIPAHEWLRGPLRPLLLDALSTESIRRTGIFSPESIQRLIALHLSRKANLGYHLWGLLTLHLWMNRWHIETGDIGAAKPEIAMVSSRD
ncbi:MAG: asparagine synthase (glutamine-hydrolyzing) [Acidobacteriaceae bacterium]|nr:asparagine synthase (glutamine-hydrolyzing) [Acidobacteriaceae bacterium]